MTWTRTCLLMDHRPPGCPRRRWRRAQRLARMADQGRRLPRLWAWTWP